MKDLRNPEKVKIGANTYVLSSIPAFQAQKMLMRAMGAFTRGDVSAIPPDLLLELLSYSAIINQNGAEVQFENEGLVEMMISDPIDLFELEARMVEKNFGFLGDGRLKDCVSRLAKVMGSKDSEAATPAT